ncbi:MAG: hypothetical protein ACOY5H_03090 [Pseudomonadota bacterium]
MDTSIFYFVLEVRSAVAEGSPLGGGYVHCWIRQPTPEAACALAMERVHAEGWAVTSCSEPTLAQRSDYLLDEDSLERYEMALRDGEALVMHGWIFEGD